jgi:hypothetical protein
MVETTTKLKKFTILHSNDMHGDFLAEAKTGQGGLIWRVIIAFWLYQSSASNGKKYTLCYFR